MDRRRRSLNNNKIETITMTTSLLGEMTKITRFKKLAAQLYS